MSMTFTVDEDLAEKLKAEADRTHRSVEEVFDHAVRRGLDEPVTPRRRFTVRARDMGVPTMNLDSISEVLAELDRLDGK